jgi:lysine 6-dehydrogenase
MSKTFAILGAGMQGTCAAYDLAKFASPARIVMGDVSLEQASANASRVNGLVGHPICEGVSVDALDAGSLTQFLADVDVLLSCVPYWMHPKVAETAIAAGVHMVDLGGDTNVSLETLKLDERAKAAGVSVIPDCGLAPGLVNDLADYLLEQFDETESVRLFCGGLPQNPKPPFNYRLAFNIEGLVTEYDGDADVIRDGKLVKVPTLTEVEPITIAGLGEMECFVTSGGASTAPHALVGKVTTYEYKTIRFPGHAALMKIFKDFGFWSHEPVQTRSGSAVPLEVFCNLMSPRLKDNDADQILVRAVGIGSKNGLRKKVQLDIHDRQDAATGFTSMERMTGFSVAIYADYVAKGLTQPGCLTYESVMSGSYFVDELQKRGVKIAFSEEHH